MRIENLLLKTAQEKTTIETMWQNGWAEGGRIPSPGFAQFFFTSVTDNGEAWRELYCHVVGQCAAWYGCPLGPAMSIDSSVFVVMGHTRKPPAWDHENHCQRGQPGSALTVRNVRAQKERKLFDNRWPVFDGRETPPRQSRQSEFSHLDGCPIATFLLGFAEGIENRENQ